MHHGYRRSVLVNAGGWSPAAEPFRFVFDQFGPVHDAWVSDIAPGGFIVPHTDASRWRVRWQVPIRPAGLTVVDDVAFGSVAGRAFPIEHWRPHAVWNFTDRARVHLVVDLDQYIDREPAEFRTYPIPSQYEEAVHGRS